MLGFDQTSQPPPAGLDREDVTVAARQPVLIPFLGVRGSSARPATAGQSAAELDALEVDLPEEFLQRLRSYRVSRRRFLAYCAGLTSLLALPAALTRSVAEGLAATGRPRVIWLEFQDCAGCTESFLRASDPDVGQLILDLISLDYQETLMAAAGAQAEAAKTAAMASPGYLLVVEGSIPSGDGAGACTIGGRAAADILAGAVKGAAAIIAVGTCATFGGIPKARPNPTSAAGVSDVVSGVPLVNLSGCPPVADNITATIAHYLSFGTLPATDGLNRPLFAYGDRIHDTCERRGYFDAGQFALAFGDEGHTSGWCLYRLGCKGPSTYNSCPSTRWNSGTSWPVQAGHGCVGCSQPDFWDSMTPFYSILPDVSGFGVEATANEIGKAVVVGTAALFAAHGVGKSVQHHLADRRARRTPSEPAAGPDAPAGPGVTP
jgi:hydrogenase small subunit